MTPNIANIIQTSNNNTPTYIIPLTLWINATMIVFISELCDITLKGLSVLKSLNILMKGILTEEKLASIKAVMTIKKSN